MDKLHRTLYILAGVLFVAFLPWNVYNEFFDETRMSLEVSASGDTLVVTLNEGSVVELKDKSTFIYAKKFSDSQRKSELRGSAKFSIIYDARPFRLKVKRFMIETNQSSFVLKEGGLVVNGSNNSGELVIYEYNDAGDVIDRYFIHDGERFELSNHVRLIK